MPPKKSKKTEEPPQSAEIVNWYEKIPKEMLDTAENPNFHSIQLSHLLAFLSAYLSKS